MSSGLVIMPMYARKTEKKKRGEVRHADRPCLLKSKAIQTRESCLQAKLFPARLTTKKLKLRDDNGDWYGSNMNKAQELSPEQFRRMQLTELEMLVEFDKVCRKNDINYVLFGGSLLGAIRHKGYIPWDDDADIGMLREDYERFKRCLNDLDGDICYFQDHDTDPEYRWGYGKLRRTGSKYIRVGQEHLKCKTGIFVDVFPMDDAPQSTFGQIVQDRICFCMRKILWSEVAKYNTRGFWKVWFTLLSHIPVSLPFAVFKRYALKSRNASPNKVRCLAFPATGTLYKKNPLSQRYAMPKSWFTDRTEYPFEGKMFYSSRDYDEVLKYIYGDYMTLPDEKGREQHSPFSSIEFPPTTGEVTQE